ncbi:MAG: hypothetical protein P8Y44_07870 [Acidobacteriota bacterium]
MTAALASGPDRFDNCSGGSDLPEKQVSPRQAYPGRRKARVGKGDDRIGLVRAFEIVLFQPQSTEPYTCYIAAGKVDRTS